MKKHEQSVAVTEETTVESLNKCVDSSSSCDLESHGDFKNLFSAFKDDLKKELSLMYTCFDDKLKDTVSKLTLSSDNSLSLVNKSPVPAQTWADRVAGDNKSFPLERQSHPTQVKAIPIFISEKTVLNAPRPDNDEVLVFSPTNIGAEINGSIVESVKKSINKELKNVQFDFLNDGSKTGKIAVRFRSSQSRKEGEDLIESSNILSSVGYQAKVAAKMLPKISLNAVHSSIFNEVQSGLKDEQLRVAQKAEIMRLILDKNPCFQKFIDDGHTCEVIYVNTKGKGVNNVYIGLKVSPALRNAILTEQSGYVFFPGNRYLFKDRFHFKQCYHCQLMGHVAEDCPEKSNDSTCLYCMGNHMSMKCTNKKLYSKHACAKCHSSKDPTDAANYKSHNSASPDCPIAVRECKRLANLTDFTSKNKL